ncbi:alpha/beta hydrolase [Vagococcus humatus]|uniref:Lipase n=1 Tax=Vagococcus humatus TaxID=1889241 RepID=A0A429Z859_9ENTE|nr:alpha/beta hydrolase [Vagococcus humatus]RST89868.1 lipase [Vagococcus humatus]
MFIKEYQLKDYHDQCGVGQLSIYLWNKEQVTPRGEKRPFVLICPGGGYEFLSLREGEPVALKLLGEGYHVGILSYTTVTCEQGAEYPCQPLVELATALEILHEKGQALGIDTADIHCLGFSAGGHLVATYTGVAQKQGAALGLVSHDLAWHLPKTQLLAYPVIDFSLGWPRETDRLGQVKQDLPAFFTKAQVLVTDQTPPTFIWQTGADQTVPIQNALVYLQALAEHKVTFESHIYPFGRHGLSLANLAGAKKEALEEYDLPFVATWLPLALHWLSQYSPYVS